MSAPTGDGKQGFLARHSSDTDVCSAPSVNRALVDPERWGWSAGGDVADLLTPHQRARRLSKSISMHRRGKKRPRTNGAVNLHPPPMEDFAPMAPLENGNVNGMLEGSQNDTPAKACYQGDKGEMDIDVQLKDGEGGVKFGGIVGGKIDSLIYHRGREGFELRDDETGLLLCDVKPTDTNHSANPPSLKTNVTVEFDLLDDQEGSFTFKESIPWDLGDSRMKTPMQYAIDISERYGLSFFKTQQIAASIQEQLRRLVQEYCAYCPPVLVQDEFLQERAAKIVPTLYGMVTGDDGGGEWYPHHQKASKHGNRRSSGILRGSGQEKPSTRGISASKRKKGSAIDVSSDGNLFEREILRRLKSEAEKEMHEKLINGDSGGKLQWLDNFVCHCCNKDSRCRVFACDIEHHALCSETLESIPYLSEDPNAACPVCTLTCPCDSCADALKILCFEFETSYEDQEVQLEETIFDDLLGRRRAIMGKVHRSKQKRRSDFAAMPRVEKVHPSEFPKEMFNNTDIDPGSEALYATVFTKNGAFHSDEVTKIVNTSDFETGDGVMEDGSVDYCNICRGVGNLLCCDFCPRAFHRQCINHQAMTGKRNDSQWKCPICIQEDEGILADQIDGNNSAELILSIFDVAAEELDEKSLALLKACCIVHEMIVHLMEYDFGAMFREPVDVEQIPTYRTIVKRPVDLSSIASNIINGIYRDRHMDQSSVLEHAIASALKDVDLVWHNCFLFNREGSAVYRMAEVHKKRVTKIRERSLDHLLSETIKVEVSNYENGLRRERQAFKPTPTLKPQPQRPRPESGHKITATSAGVKGRPIAVLDPDSGKIVKLYATMASVVLVFNLFFNLELSCEFERSGVDTANKVRRLIVSSQENHRIRVFGYRWLFLDDLEKGRVRFDDQAPNGIGGNGRRKQGSVTNANEKKRKVSLVELLVDDRCYIFEGLDMALAYVDQDNTIPLDLEKQLAQTSEYVCTPGKKWKRLELNSNGKLLNGFHTDLNMLAVPGLTIVKRDILSHCRLVGFRTEEVAHHDWLRTIKSSSTNPQGKHTLDDFRSMYLEGEENFDGLVWSYVKCGMVISSEVDSKFPPANGIHPYALDEDKRNSDDMGNNVNKKAEAEHTGVECEGDRVA